MIDVAMRKNQLQDEELTKGNSTTLKSISALC
jgi:hypothetical protein